MAYGSNNITKPTSPTRTNMAGTVARLADKPTEKFPSEITSSVNEKDVQPVTLVREQFDKEAFKQTIDTNFSQLGVQEPDLSFFDPNLANVGDFFSVYNNLFFLIPKEGPNSHTTLIEESTEFVDYKANQLEIQALLDEIAELREQNLQLTIDIGNITNAQSEINRAIEEVEALETQSEG